MQARGGDFAVSSPNLGLGGIRRSRAESASLMMDKKIDISGPEEVATAVEPAKVEKLSTELWCINGNFYDLTPFIPSHPGGHTILELSKGMADATPVMESYHAFANKEYIAKTLAKYRVDYVPKDALTRETTETTYTFEPNGFYATLTRRVRAHFGSTKEGESVTKNIKANKWWVLKVVVQSALFLGFYGAAFLLPNVNRLVSVVLAATAGMLLIAVGMNAMHDASHYAVGVRDSWKNTFTLRVWNAIAYWDPSLWLFHHTIRHHAYTGDGKLDPDTLHANPAVRKHLDTDRKLFFNNFPRVLVVEQWFWALWASFIYLLFPGMYTMQCVSYRILWPLKGTLWNMAIEPTKGVFTKYWWETALTFSMIAAHLYKMDPIVSFAYFFGSNVAYAMCIVPDHDTHESAIENHVAGGKIDWGEIQVRHASDFGGHGFWGRAFTEWFGSINVQIAHHLYPSVNHIYLPEIQQLIMDTSKEFNIPYARQKTIPEAIGSFFRTVYRCMGPEGDMPHVKTQ